jgi:hypothetical protein
MYWKFTVKCINYIEAFILEMFLSPIFKSILIPIISLLISNINKIVKMDAFSSALFISKIWAIVGLYMAKLFETIFQLIVKLPDEKFAILTNNFKFLNTEGNKINVLLASDGKNIITNKLKLFIKYYLEKGGVFEAIPTNGFDFAKFEKIFKSSVLYCCHLTENRSRDDEKHYSTTFNSEFWDNLIKFIIYRVDDVIYKKTENDTYKLSLRNVDFDKKTEEMSFEDLTKIMSEFN